MVKFTCLKRIWGQIVRAIKWSHPLLSYATQCTLNQVSAAKIQEGEWNTGIVTFTPALFRIWKVTNNLNTYNWKIVKQVTFPLNRKL